MSVEKKIINQTPEKVALEIDNGDLEAIKTVMEQYGFVSEEALLRYVLVSLLNSTDNRLHVKRNGNIVAMNIAEILLKNKPAMTTGAGDSK